MSENPFAIEDPSIGPGQQFGQSQPGRSFTYSPSTVQPLSIPGETVTPELAAALARTTLVNAIVEVNVRTMEDVRSRLSGFNVPILDSISFRKFGLEYISIYLRREQADKVADLPSVARIHFDRPIRMNTGPIREMLQKVRSRPPIVPFKVKEGMIPNSWVKKALGGYDAKDDGYSGEGVKYAVCDTGFTANRQFPVRGVRELSVLSPFGTGSRDTSGHSTWCISSIGGRPIDIGSGVIVEGMCPGAQMTSIKCLFSPLGIGTVSSTLKAMQMAYESDVDIVSMSLGGIAPTPPGDPSEQVIRAMVKDGKIVCVSAGNSGPGPNTVFGPADIDDAIAVGSVSFLDGKPAYFSSRGTTADGRTKPEILCYGGGRFSGATRPQETVISSSAGLIDASDGGFRLAATAGTSMACPNFAGMLGWWKQLYESRMEQKMTHSVVLQVMKDMGQPKTNDQGYGVATYSWMKDWLKS